MIEAPAGAVVHPHPDNTVIGYPYDGGFIRHPVSENRHAHFGLGGFCLGTRSNSVPGDLSARSELRPP
jgi:hypothetical protein